MRHWENTVHRANVEIVQQVYDAMRRRDAAGIMRLLAPDIEMTQSAEVPWGGTYRGHAEVQQFFGKLRAAISSTAAVDVFIDAGDHVVAVGSTKGTVNANGRAFDLPFVHIWEFKAKRVSRVQFYIENPSMLSAILES